MNPPVDQATDLRNLVNSTLAETLTKSVVSICGAMPGVGAKTLTYLLNTAAEQSNIAVVFESPAHSKTTWLITTPTPESISAAYAYFKRHHIRETISLVVNYADETTGRNVHGRIKDTARRFLAAEIPLAGVVPRLFSLDSPDVSTATEIQSLLRSALPFSEHSNSPFCEARWPERAIESAATPKGCGRLIRKNDNSC